MSEFPVRVIDLEVRVVAVRNHCWELARFGPRGLERVMQSDHLPAAVAELLASTLEVKWPERCCLKLTLQLTRPPEPEESP